MKKFLVSDNSKIADAAFLRAAYGVLNDEKDFDLEEMVAINSEKTFESIAVILGKYNKPENLAMFERFLAIVQDQKYQNKKEVFRALLKVYTNTKFLQTPTNYAIVHDYIYVAEDKIELLFERAREKSIQPMILEMLPKAGKALGRAVCKSIEGYSNNVSLEVIKAAIDYLDASVLVKMIVRSNMDGDVLLRQEIIEKIINKYPLIVKSSASYLLMIVFENEFERAFRLELLQKVLKYKLSRDSFEALQKNLGKFLEKADLNKEWPILEQAFIDYVQTYGDEEDILYIVDGAAKERAGYKIFDNFIWLCNESYAKADVRMLNSEVFLLKHMRFNGQLRSFDESFEASCFILMLIAEASDDDKMHYHLILDELIDYYACSVYQLVDFINDKNRNYVTAWLDRMLLFCGDDEYRKTIIEFCLENQLKLADLEQKYPNVIDAIDEENFQKEYEAKALEILRLP